MGVKEDDREHWKKVLGRRDEVEELKRRIADVEQYLLDQAAVQKNRATMSQTARYREALEVFRSRQKYG